MFVSSNWKDYTLLDAGNGERLEKWGSYILRRPDPQAIWNASSTASANGAANAWDKADGIYRRSSGGGGSWVKKQLPESWEIGYGELRFVVSPMGFKHTGVFPEQAANWDWFVPLIKGAGREIRLLNLFAYTGGATVAAAKAGAFVCHVDASKGMVARAGQNAAKSGVRADRIRFIVDDCFKFVRREARRNSKYDAIILDPPSYGRGPRGEKWSLEQNLSALVRDLVPLLSDDPLFVLLNSYTTGLSPSVCGCVLSLALKPRFGGRADCGELGLPMQSNGLCLPCGASARYTFEARSARK